MKKPLEIFCDRYMFTLFAATGAAAEWLLACWAVPALRAVSLGVHAAVLAALIAANRVCARIVSYDPPQPARLAVPAQTVIGAAFASLAGTAVLFAFTIFTMALDRVGEPAVEAGMLAGHGAFFAWPADAPLALPLVALAMGAIGYGYVRGQRQLEVTRHTIALSGLGGPLRVVHVSDLHVGPMASMDVLREAIDRILALDPDLVCVTGDIIDNHRTDVGRWLPELARLTARHGVFAILGNHDRHIGADDVARALRERTSWRVLRDDIATIDVDGARVNVIGFEDRPHHCATDGLAPLLARAPRGEPSILLAHRPCVFPMAAAAGVHLMLAGHTHGGQLAVPGAPRLNVARAVMGRFDAGAFTLGGSTLYVSRGLGVSGQPLRIGVPREIAALTLVDAAS